LGREKSLTYFYSVTVPIYYFFLAKKKAVSRGVMPAGGQHKSTPHQADRDIDMSALPYF
jgi:hypothetical protein